MASTVNEKPMHFGWSSLSDEKRQAIVDTVEKGSKPYCLCFMGLETRVIGFHALYKDDKEGVDERRNLPPAELILLSEVLGTASQVKGMKVTLVNLVAKKIFSNDTRFNGMWAQINDMKDWETLGGEGRQLVCNEIHDVYDVQSIQPPPRKKGGRRRRFTIW